MGRLRIGFASAASSPLGAGATIMVVQLGDAAPIAILSLDVPALTAELVSRLTSTVAAFAGGARCMITGAGAPVAPEAAEPPAASAGQLMRSVELISAQAWGDLTPARADVVRVPGRPDTDPLADELAVLVFHSDTDDRRLGVLACGSGRAPARTPKNEPSPDRGGYPALGGALDTPLAAGPVLFVSRSEPDPMGPAARGARRAHHPAPVVNTARVDQPMPVELDHDDQVWLRQLDVPLPAETGAVIMASTTLIRVGPLVLVGTPFTMAPRLSREIADAFPELLVEVTRPVGEDLGDLPTAADVARARVAGMTRPTAVTAGAGEYLAEEVIGELKALLPSARPVDERAEDFFGRVWCAHDVDFVSEAVARRVAGNDEKFGTTRDSFVERWREWLRAFPDLRLEPVRTIAHRNQVATLWRMTGTHSGEFDGVPATGSAVDLDGVSLDRFENGLLVSGGDYWDSAELYRQLTGRPVWPGGGVEMTP